MRAPDPTPIFRLLHIENLRPALQRRALCSPNHTPPDGMAYRAIHDSDIQEKRHIRPIPCGPGGVIHDYVSFYFGTRSPMLYRLHTGSVQGYAEGQSPLIYVVSTAQKVKDKGCGFVFSDGHGIASRTRWFTDLRRLDELDWKTINAAMWCNTEDDQDRQRRRQAEFLIHWRCSWSLVLEVGVYDDRAKSCVREAMWEFPSEMRRTVKVRRSWYY